MGLTADQRVLAQQVADHVRDWVQSISISNHALERFFERGGRMLYDQEVPKQLRAKRSHQRFFFKTVMSISAVELNTRKDRNLPTPVEVLERGVEVVLLPLCWLSPRGLERRDPPTELPLVAVIKDKTVVTVLEKPMVQHNIDNGFYTQRDGSRFSLTQPLLKKEQVMASASDGKRTYAWAYDFFLENPKASVTGALKVANNHGDVPLLLDVMRDARRAAHEELNRRAVQSPAAVERIEAEVEEKRRHPAALAAVQPVVKEPPPMAVPTNLKPVENTAPVRGVQDVEQEALAPIAKQIAETMRQLGMASCVFTLHENESGGIEAEWDIEYKRKGRGKLTF